MLLLAAQPPPPDPDRPRPDEERRDPQEPDATDPDRARVPEVVPPSGVHPPVDASVRPPQEDAPPASNASAAPPPGESDKEQDVVPPEPASETGPRDVAEPVDLAPPGAAVDSLEAESPPVEEGEAAIETPPELPSYPRTTPAPPPPPTEKRPELPSYPRNPGDRAAARAEARRAREEPTGPDLPSYPRDPGRRGHAEPPSMARRVLLSILLIGAVALIGYALTQQRDPDTGPDVLTQAAVAARAAGVSELTDDPARARQFVRDEFGWRMGVPVFQGATLRGVGISQISPGVEVPILRYADERGRQVTVFALNYALLDQVPDRLRLSRADYERLAVDTRPSVRRMRGSDLLLWRDRSDIYIAVTAIPPPELVDQLVMAR